MFYYNFFVIQIYYCNSVYNNYQILLVYQRNIEIIIIIIK